MSGLFRKGHRCAAVLGVPWFVLSAEHGLVSPSTTLPPYDRRLANTNAAYRRAWGEQVADQLTAELGSVAGKVVEVHAGATYVEPIRRQLTLAGATLVEPLAGLTRGARLAWYNNTLPPEATCQSSLPAPDVVEVVARLTDVSTALTPAEFLATEGIGLSSPGLYSWWVDQEGAAELSRGLGGIVEPGLVYAGLAGATRRGGRKLRNTLWGRIKTMHLGGRHEFSTFRLSVGSVLAEARGAEEIDEAQLTTWIHDHLRVIAVPVDDADILASVFHEVVIDGVAA